MLKFVILITSLVRKKNVQSFRRFMIRIGSFFPGRNYVFVVGPLCCQENKGNERERERDRERDFFFF